MKAELKDFGGGMQLDIHYKDNGLDKKVKLMFGLTHGDQFLLTLSREVLEDLVGLMNKEGVE
jgi:hypothetical protein